MSIRYTEMLNYIFPVHKTCQLKKTEELFHFFGQFLFLIMYMLLQEIEYFDPIFIQS